jgi:glycerol uptake facilitator-like aquaporin
VFAEVVATFGLLLLIFALVRSGRAATAAAGVGA